MTDKNHKGLTLGELYEDILQSSRLIKQDSFDTTSVSSVGGIATVTPDQRSLRDENLSSSDSEEDGDIIPLKRCKRTDYQNLYDDRKLASYPCVKSLTLTQDICCEKLPAYLAAAYNSGEQSAINMLIDKYVNSNVIFRIRKPLVSREEVGPSAIISFYQHCMRISPDAVMVVRGVKKTSHDDGYMIRSKVNFTGTLMPHDDTIPLNLCELVDTNKTSSADVEAIRLSQILIREQGKMIRGFFKGGLSIVVNPTNQKVDVFDISLCLTSVSAFDK